MGTCASKEASGNHGRVCEFCKLRLGLEGEEEQTKLSRSAAANSQVQLQKNGGAAAISEATAAAAMKEHFGMRYMLDGLEVSARVCAELSTQVPMFGVVFSAIALICQTALHAAHQKKYARRHAIKVCAYRGWLEPLRETFSNKAVNHKNLLEAIDRFDHVLRVFATKLADEVGASAAERVLHAFTSDDPLEKQWNEVEDASAALQKAIGAHSLIKIDGLVDSQQNVQLQLALIAAQLTEVHTVSSRLSLSLEIQQQQQQQQSSPTHAAAVVTPSSPASSHEKQPDSPVVDADGIELQPVAERGEGRTSPPPPAMNNPAGRRRDGEDVTASYADPFLEALVRRFQLREANQREANDALEQQLKAREKELQQQQTELNAVRTENVALVARMLEQKEQDEEAGKAAETKIQRAMTERDQGLAQVAALEKEVQRLREEEKVAAERIAQLVATTVEKDKRLLQQSVLLEELEQQLAAEEQLLAASQNQSKLSSTLEEECERLRSINSQQETTVQELRTSLAVALDEKEAAHAKITSQTNDATEIAAASRRLVPQRPLLPPVLTDATSSSNESGAAASSGASRAHAIYDADPLCNAHQQPMARVCSGCRVGLCTDCLDSHDTSSGHIVVDFASFAAQLREQIENEHTFSTITATLADCDKRAEQWHAQAVTAQELANNVQQRIDKEVMDYLVGEVARMNALLDQFASALQPKANSYIERGLARKKKQRTLHSKLAYLREGLQSVLTRGDAVMACRLPVLLTDLHVALQFSKREEADLQTLTLERFSRGIQTIGTVCGGLVLDTLANVVSASMEEGTGTFLSQTVCDDQRAPVAVAVADGLLYVLCEHLHIFDAITLEPRKSCGQEKKSWSNPEAIACANSLLYVGTWDAVEVTDTVTLASRKVVGSFYGICGLAVGGGMLYVAGSEDDEIWVQMFDAVTLAFVRRTPEDQFRSFFMEGGFGAIAVAGSLLYLGCIDHVQVLDAVTLEFRNKIGSPGSLGKYNCGAGNGQFSRPSGIAVAGGFLYVADGNDRVQVFDAVTLKYHHTIGSHGVGKGQFSSLAGIAIAGGLLYVADGGNKRIQVIRT